VIEWLHHIPPLAVYLVVGGVIMLESLGIPLPGEIVLVTAALLSHEAPNVNPVLVAAFASAGAIIGDTIGYAIGHRYGRPLFEKLGRRFPKHFGPAHLAVAERVFHKYGMWAVFFGRFVALLRIFAGPLAGVLRMPYYKFLIANAAGGIVWASGTTAVIYFLGEAAEKWLGRFSWLGLLLAIVFGLAVGWYMKHRTAKAAEAHEAAELAAVTEAPAEKA
jgi:membrane protein DedA with SNARE-associated domain